MRASTTALPPLTCTARGRRHPAAVVFCCKAGHLWPCVLRPVPGGESAGCVRLQCLFSRLLFCLPAIFACHAHCPHQHLAPIQVCLPPSISVCFCFVCPCSMPCAPGSPFVRASSLPAARLSRWQLQHGPAVAARATGPFDCSFFPAESMILGHGLV